MATAVWLAIVVFGGIRVALALRDRHVRNVAALKRKVGKKCGAK